MEKNNKYQKNEIVTLIDRKDELGTIRGYKIDKYGLIWYDIYWHDAKFKSFELEEFLEISEVNVLFDSWDNWQGEDYD